MPNDPDRTDIARVTNRLHQRHVVFTFAQRKNLLSLLLTITSHAIQIQAEKIRLHLLQYCCEVVDVFMGVMLVVDNAHVIGVVVLAKVLAYRHHIRWLAMPTSVVIQPKLACKLSSPFDDGQDLHRSLMDAFFLRLCFWRRQHLPNLRLQSMLLEQLKRLVMHAPKRKVLKPISLVLKNLLLECRHMLLPPVVGDTT